MMSRSLPLATTSPLRPIDHETTTTTTDTAAATTPSTPTAATTAPLVASPCPSIATTTTTATTARHHRRTPSASSNASNIAAVAGGNTIRRLSDDDVRTIFECLHHRQHLPQRLHFTIVKVGPNGLRLSPPSYEFEDGLYVLLRPPKKSKAGQPVEMPSPPDHLHHLVAGDDWEETCPWSLSGPQFPQPTAIQQRYCYPKGPPEYSSRVGGALWTMYGATGKEDLEFRLLHVYYSAKRAVNKGYAVPPPPMLPSKAYNTPSPQRRSRAAQQKKKAQQQAKQQQQQQQQQFPMSAPALPHPGSSGICHSPLSIDWSMTPSSLPPSCSRSSLGSGNYNQNHHHHNNNNSNDPTNLVVTPYCSDLFRHRHPGSNSSTTTFSSPTFSTPSPMRKRGRMSYDDSPEQASSTALSSTKSLDALDMETGLQDIESYWNDPLMNIFMQPSHDAPFPPSTAMNTSTGSNVTNNILTATAAGTNPTVALSYSPSPSHHQHHQHHHHHHSGALLPLSQRLARLHDKLRDMVAEDDEAATVVHDWAERLAHEFKGKVQL